MALYLVKAWHRLHIDNGGTYNDPPLFSAVIRAAHPGAACGIAYLNRYWVGRVTAEEIPADGPEEMILDDGNTLDH